ncbi:MAG: anaerobic ribonucleoside-triphosphate reductase activating protein [Desulfobacteraceae bacterium]|nr:MAG: anaerobic ribonucleoside-triphosphate reductase activating protein [Desulfobacteraceae bacterium]
MIFGGIQKNSLIDYPGKISCVLFTSGCNFACPYCHNPDLAKNKPSVSITEGEIYAFLENRKNFLDGAVISGGEPTIHYDIEIVCQNIKTLGYSVKLDTNGSNPSVIKKLIDSGLVDYIAMDIKTDPALYSFFIKYGCESSDILSSIKTIMNSAIDYEFRTTCVKPFINTPVIEKILSIINGANLYVLQHFQNKNVLDPDFFAVENCGFSEDEMLEIKTVAECCVGKCIIR